MADKKTKKELFTELKEIVSAAQLDEDRETMYLDFIDRQIASIDKRAETAKARAEEKKVASDALTDAIYDLVTDEPKTVEDLVGEIDDEEVTRNKVTSRLGRLVKSGLVNKETVKIEGIGRRMVYTRVSE